MQMCNKSQEDINSTDPHLPPKKKKCKEQYTLCAGLKGDESHAHAISALPIL